MCSVLTVSANYVNAWLQALCEELPQHTTPADEVVLLHFGVDRHCQSDMKLEARLPASACSAAAAARCRAASAGSARAGSSAGHCIITRAHRGKAG